MNLRKYGILAFLALGFGNASLASQDLPLLQAFEAATQLKIMNSPFNDRAKPLWDSLKDPRATTINSLLLVELISHLSDQKEVHQVEKYLGQDWAFFQGNEYDRKADFKSAFEAYGKVDEKSYLYDKARYLQAMSAVEMKDYETAAKILEKQSSDSNLKDLYKDTVLLALGRIYYQMERFKESIHSYRAVRKNGPMFYTALFEQAWALFMAGYPRYSLGMVYDFKSPFFSEKVNPEAEFLRSLAYFWLCRYDDAKRSLAAFYHEFEKSEAGFKGFLARPVLTQARAYQLFEDFVSGVSSESLGIDRDLLKMAASQAEMMALRKQFAAVLEERRGAGENQPRYRKFVEKLKLSIGGQFLRELRSLEQEFDQLKAQAKFLRLELLMGEKEHLLGRELHASNKVTPLKDVRAPDQWAKDKQEWAADNKKEYWWDEVGFHIARAQSQCHGE